MIFRITLETQSTLRLEWSECPRPIFDEIVRRIKTIPGAAFDSEEGCWHLPVTTLYTTLSLFTQATVDYECFQAADAARSRAAAQFAALLAQNGARLAFDESGDVVAVGACVSPLVADEVRKRSAVLRAHVGSQVVTTPHRETQCAVEVTDEDLRYAPVLTGIRNAWQAEQERGERASAQRRRKGSYEQGRLIR